MLLKRIRQLCLSNDISLAELERILGFGNGAISKWDTTKPSIDRVAAVAEYFNVSIDSLLQENSVSKEDFETAQEISALSESQKVLVKGYIALIKTKKMA